MITKIKFTDTIDFEFTHNDKIYRLSRTGKKTLADLYRKINTLSYQGHPIQKYDRLIINSIRILPFDIINDHGEKLTSVAARCYLHKDHIIIDKLSN